jgi:Domain of unknown function (DUF1737)
MNERSNVMGVKTYDIASASDTIKLSIQVRELIAKGWQPWGDMSHVVYHSGTDESHEFIQPVVIVEEGVLPRINKVRRVK